MLQSCDLKLSRLSDEIEALEEVLTTGGLHAALGFLNARAPHRFTGIYRIEAPILRSVHLFDRENPALEVGADAPVRETYCALTGSSASPYSTADARADERLHAHPARESTLSYCGVPLLDGSGTALGTLCHFDLVPQPVPRSEIALLEAAAERLVRELRRRGRLPSA